MTLACEGSAAQALEATRCGSFDFARRLASLRMTLHSVIRNPTTEPTGEPARAQRKRLTCRTHVLYWTEWRFLSRTTGRAGRRSAWCCRATSATAWRSARRGSGVGAGARCAAVRPRACPCCWWIRSWRRYCARCTSWCCSTARRCPASRCSQQQRGKLVSAEGARHGCRLEAASSRVPRAPAPSIATHLPKSKSAGSVRAWHTQHVLAHVGQHQVVVDRRHAVQPRLAEFALDVELDRKAVAAVRIQARVGRVPRRLGGQQFGHVGFGAALLASVEEPGRLVPQQIRRLESRVRLGDRELHALVGADRSTEDNPL